MQSGLFQGGSPLASSIPGATGLSYSQGGYHPPAHLSLDRGASYTSPAVAAELGAAALALIQGGHPQGRSQQMLAANTGYPPLADLVAQPEAASSNASAGRAMLVADHLPPVPPRLVSRIQGGQFVEFAELLPSAMTKENSYTDMDERSRPARSTRIRSFQDWLGGWVCYSSILLDKYPHRSRDLLAYLATVLQAYTDYGEDRWLNYDRSFRQNAAARGLEDWSVRDTNLWSYAFTRPKRIFCEFCESEAHSAADCPSAKPQYNHSSRPQYNHSSSAEPRGTQSSSEICRSWNAGHCVALNTICRYRHTCNIPDCNGSHRASFCSKRPRPFRDGSFPPTKRFK